MEGITSGLVQWINPVSSFAVVILWQMLSPHAAVTTRRTRGSEAVRAVLAFHVKKEVIPITEV